MSQPMKNSERSLNPLPWTERPKTFSCFPCYHTCGSASSEHSETLKSQSFLFQAWYSQNILRLYCFRVTRLWACWGTHVVILAEDACCEHVVSLSYWSFFCSKFNQRLHVEMPNHPFQPGGCSIGLNILGMLLIQLNKA